jgi:LCP family protein required for cell wall assembly
LSQKLNNILFFFAGVLVVGIVVVLAVAVQAKTQSQEENEAYLYELQTADESASAMNSDVEKWQEGTIEYNGKYYRYNNYIRSYLLMGIDSDDPVETAEDGVSGGQSDAMFLLVVDSENETLSVISINRNTMTAVDVYDEDGNGLGIYQAQICTQHGFGDGKKLSCTRTVSAVKNLFYNIPIAGYLSINMGAIPQLNDAIGGVEVEVLEDISYPAKNVSLTAGDTVTLNGQEAYCYVRGRDVNDFDSATERLRRDEQYIIQFMNQLKSFSGGNAEVAAGIYDSVSDYIVSSVDFAALAEDVIGYEFSDDIMYTVPGETAAGDKYEEYQVDEAAFYDLIIHIFYNEVTQ